MGAPAIPITGDEATDRLLEEEPLALLIGMLLDQQVPMEWAFKGPMTLRTRLGGSLDAREIAAMEVETFVGVCSQKPAVHRFPASMGRRIHELCVRIADEYDDDAAAIWRDETSGSELQKRLLALPGFGEEKTKIFIAILAKRFDIRPRGWEAAAAPFSDAEPRSVADVDSEDSLVRVREWKRAMKAARKSKQGNPV
jgi:uncharacterized HhH-GPD family protein